MKHNLFEGDNLTPRQIADQLETNAYGVEELHDFLKPFTDDEYETVKSEYVEKSKDLGLLEDKLAAIAKPIKEEMEPLKKALKKTLVNIKQGGELVSGKVFTFPDYESKLTYLYNEQGILVGTRAMTRQERQYSLNGNFTINKAV
jgi:hypothetical protein